MTQGVTLHHSRDSQDHRYESEIQQLGPVFTTHTTSLSDYDTEIKNKITNINRKLVSYNDYIKQYQAIRQRSADIASVLFGMENDEKTHLFVRLLPKILVDDTKIIDMYEQNSNFAGANNGKTQYKTCRNHSELTPIQDNEFCNASFIHLSKEQTPALFCNSLNLNDCKSVADCFSSPVNDGNCRGNIEKKECFTAAYSTYGESAHVVYTDDNGDLCLYTNNMNMDDRVPGNVTNKYTFKYDGDTDTKHISKFNDNIDKKLYWVPFEKSQPNDLTDENIAFIDDTHTILANSDTQTDNFHVFENYILISGSPSYHNVYNTLKNMKNELQNNNLDHTTFAYMEITSSNNVIGESPITIYINNRSLSNYLIVNTNSIPGIEGKLYIRKRIPKIEGNLLFEKKKDFGVIVPDKDTKYDYPDNGGVLNHENIVSRFNRFPNLNANYPVTSVMSNSYELQNKYLDGGSQNIMKQIKTEYITIVNRLKKLSNEINKDLKNVYYYRTFGNDMPLRRSMTKSGDGTEVSSDDASSSVKNFDDIISNLNPTTQQIVSNFDMTKPVNERISAGIANHLSNDVMNVIMKEIGKNYLHIMEDQKNLEKLYMMGEDTKILGKSQYHMYIIYLLAIILVLYGLYKASK